MKETQTLYYVLPEGATQEEQWTRDAIEEMCASGKFNRETRVFLPERNCWVPIVETDLAGALQEPGEAAEDAVDEETESIRREYDEALSRIGAQGNVSAHIDAGRLAAELGDREASRRHFQQALDIKPFNNRVAHEIRRRFSKSECSEFRFLQRDLPVWDDLPALASFPFTRGVVYFVVPAVVIDTLSYVPFGNVVVCAFLFLWCIQTTRRVAEMERRPPLWHHAASNPLQEIVMPLVAGLAVLAEFYLAFYGIARLTAYAAGQPAEPVSRFVAGSPVLLVSVVVLGLAYVPAVLVRTARSTGFVIGLLNPVRNIRVALEMEQEYALTVVFLLLVMFVLGGVELVVGWIPVVGRLIVSAVIAYTVPAVGLVLGRLCGRMRHLL
jgi:hypothetical protein